MVDISVMSTKSTLKTLGGMEKAKTQRKKCQQKSRFTEFYEFSRQETSTQKVLFLVWL